MVDLNTEPIEFLLPEYVQDIGNCTRLYSSEGSRLIKKSIKTVIKNLCKQNEMRSSLSKSQCMDILGIKHNIPIPISPEEIYIKVKTRVPCCKNDGAYGYLNLKYLEGIIEEEEEVLIKITSGELITSLSKINTLQKNINNGRIIYKFMEKEIELNYMKMKNKRNEKLLMDSYIDEMNYKIYDDKIENIYIHENID